MGTIVVRDQSGIPYTVQIAGDTPTESEQGRIDSYLSVVGRQAPVQEVVDQEPAPKSSGGLRSFVPAFGRGLVSTISQVPGGIAQLAEAGLGYDVGSTALGAHLEAGSRRADERIRNWFGEPDNSMANTAGEALGSLTSFLIPGTLVGKGALALGAGVRGASLAGGLTASGMGAALGAQDQMARIEQAIASGQTVGEDAIRKAILTGGAIGLSEGIPVEMILGNVMRILGKVPKEARDQALMTIAGRLKSAGKNALAEGGQELLSGIAQDLAEKGFYNPNVQIGQSALQDLAAGGGAGGVVTLLLDSIAGRHLRGAARKDEQIKQDAKARQEDAARQVEFGRNAIEDQSRTEASDALNAEDQAAYQAQQDQIAKEAPARRAEVARQRAEAVYGGGGTGQAIPLPQAATVRPKGGLQDGGSAAPQIVPASSAAPIVVADQPAGAQRPAMVRPQQPETALKPQAGKLVTSKVAPQVAEQVTPERSQIVKEHYVKTATKARKGLTGVERAVDDIKMEKEIKTAEPMATVVPETVRPKKPPTFEMVRASLPVDTSGSPDVQGKLAPAISQVAGETKPWGKLTNDQKRSVADLLNVKYSAEPVAKSSPEQSVPVSGNVSGNVRATSPMAGSAIDWNAKRERYQARNYVPEVYTPEYQAKRDAAVGALRSDLAKYVPASQVDIVADRVLRPDLLRSAKPELVEGMQGIDNSGRQIIALATDIYDPSMSMEEYTQRLRDVMHHELIHAMRSLGLFTDKEWNNLVHAAETTRYVAVIDGKKMVRDYTFMEREDAKNAGLSDTATTSLEQAQEEAVAEMFRSHMAGNIRLVGQPKSLLGRILKFLRSIVGANRQAGFVERDRIFQSIASGEIGSRPKTGSRGGVRNSSYISGTYDTSNLQFHSHLGRELWNAKQKSASPQDWKAIISRIPGVKQKEIEWSGINTWLDQQANDGVKQIRREDVGRRVLEMTPKLIEFKKEHLSRDEVDRRHAEHERAKDFGEDVLNPIDGPPQFESYTEKGGTNYREFLITDPDLHKHDINSPVSNSFMNENHFSEPNILVHIRANDRTDLDGNKVLFVEEVQSDLGSKLRDLEPWQRDQARKYGGEITRLRKEKENIRRERNLLIDKFTHEISSQYDFYIDLNYEQIVSEAALFSENKDYANEHLDIIKGDDGRITNESIINAAKQYSTGNITRAIMAHEIFNNPDEYAADILKHILKKDMEYDISSERELQFLKTVPEWIRGNSRHATEIARLPDMPFTDNAYYELAAKRMLNEAGRNGYKKLAWTPGYMQSERWRQMLGSRVNSIRWMKPESGKTHVIIELKTGDKDAYQKVELYADDEGVIRDESHNFNMVLVSKNLSEVLGNEISKQILSEEQGDIDPKNMSFGKSGFTQAYDSAIRKAVEKITKRYGVKPQLDTGIIKSEKSETDDEDYVRRILRQKLLNKNIVDFAIDKNLLSEEQINAHYNNAVRDAESDWQWQYSELERYERMVNDGIKLNPAGIDDYNYHKRWFEKYPNIESRINELFNSDVYHALNDMPPYIVLGTRPAGKAVWSVDITPEMSKAFRQDTMPLYSAQPVTQDINTVLDRKDERLNYTFAYDRLKKALNLVPYVDGEKADRAAQWFITQFQDRMVPVGKIIDRLRASGLTVTDAMDTIRKEQISHGIIGIEQRESDRKLYAPMIEAVRRLKVHMDNFKALSQVSDFAKYADKAYNSHVLATAEAYLYARHAKERNAFVLTRNETDTVGSGMTAEEADAIIGWFDRQNNNIKRDLMNIAELYRAITRDTTRRRMDGGLIGRETPDPFKNYAVLRGKLDANSLEEDDIYPESAGMARARPLYGATGREDPAIMGRGKPNADGEMQGVYARDLLANAMAQNTQAIQRAERNKVGRSTIEMLRAHGGSVPEMRIIQFPNGQDTVPMGRQLVNGKVRLGVEDYKNRRDKYFVVKEDGRPVVVEIDDPRIAQALNGSITTSSANAVVRGMSTINRFLANINTSWNPEFMFSNLPRDIATALYNAGQYDLPGIRTEVAKNMLPALKGIRDALRGNGDSDMAKAYMEYVKAGGQNSLNTMENLNSHIATIEQQLREVSDESAKGNVRAVRDFLTGNGKSLLNLIEDYNTVAENSSRLALFKSLRDRGVSLDRAAQAAREITTNFAKGGEFKVPMNAFYLFYNASLQGSMAIFTATMKNPKKMAPTLAKIVLFGIIMDQLNSLFSPEDDDGKLVYDKLSDYTLEHNLIIPIRAFSDRSFIRIPLPYGLNMFFNWGRALSRMGRGTYPTKDIVNTLYGSVLETVNPFGDNYNPFTGEGSFMTMVSPTISDPFFQIANNEDFADRPIYKEPSQFGVGGPQSYQYWASTNPAIVATTKWINDHTGGTPVVPGYIDMNPDKVEFWIDYATGAMGQFIMRTANSPFLLMDTLGSGIQDDMINSIPFGRKFTISVTEREDVGAFAEKRDKVLMAKKELKDAIESHDRERIAYARQRYGNELRIAPSITKINDTRNKLRQQRAKIEKSTTLSDAQKQKMYDRLDEKMNTLVARANKLMKNVQ